ncbi:DUF2958 domain-containing protein [Acidimangrovimonas pyrenivorans]|uniref:DUF2958 domain-containing protein n=1 Tax=Acidimangrovimonas pyrenivorans TaxID=2030798 RepID=A0ABV7AD29_9RHOB
MKLILADQYEQLIAQGRSTAAALAEGQEPPEHKPVVKLFTPDANCTWLISELDPDDPDIAFGLCDIGFGCAELGTVRISEIESIRGALGLPAERDRHFCPERSLGEYAEIAHKHGRIVA